VPTILREYDKVARQCAEEKADFPRYLLRLTELELLDRDRRATERRIRQAKFPVVKTIDTFDFLAILRQQDAGAGSGSVRVPLPQGERVAARQQWNREDSPLTGPRSSRVSARPPCPLYNRLGAGQRTDRSRDEKHLLRFQKLMASYELLIVDELGFVPLSKIGAELLFETFSQRYERASTLVTSNLPFEEWTEVFGSERLTGALLDRLTHHVHIIEMNGDSYRLKHSRRKRTLLPNAEIPHPAERAAGEQGLFRYAQEALLPRKSPLIVRSAGNLFAPPSGLLLLRP